ncbi:MAG: hypothetical protein ACRD2A_00045 [Vicinamibacterales bacterium]
MRHLPLTGNAGKQAWAWVELDRHAADPGIVASRAYHEFSQPEPIMEAIPRSLKASGRLVIVEYAKELKRAPAAPLHKMSFDEMREEIEPIGFDLEQILDFLTDAARLIFTVR